jgi:hypothetical protein
MGECRAEKPWIFEVIAKLLLELFSEVKFSGIRVGCLIFRHRIETKISPPSQYIMISTVYQHTDCRDGHIKPVTFPTRKQRCAYQGFANVGDGLVSQCMFIFRNTRLILPFALKKFDSFRVPATSSLFVSYIEVK